MYTNNKEKNSSEELSNWLSAFLCVGRRRRNAIGEPQTTQEAPACNDFPFASNQGQIWTTDLEMKCSISCYQSPGPSGPPDYSVCENTFTIQYLLTTLKLVGFEYLVECKIPQWLCSIRKNCTEALLFIYLFTYLFVCLFLPWISFVLKCEIK